MLPEKNQCTILDHAIRENTDKKECWKKGRVYLWTKVDEKDLRGGEEAKQGKLGGKSLFTGKEM